MENILQDLVGKKINKIYLNEDYLKFETDEGNFVYTVLGDCCSSSLFYDFYGVKELLGKKVISVAEKELTADDIKQIEYSSSDKKGEHEDISVYGYQIFTEDKDLGERTSVFSFRNYSNGYYGGWMEKITDFPVFPEIIDDVIETQSTKK